VVGGAVVTGISWHWIFWLNVPVGLIVAPLALTRLTKSRGPNSRIDLAGLGLASAGLFGIVYGVVRANTLGWGSLTISASLSGGVLLLVGFVVWELRTAAPMLPMRFFRSRAFSATNAVSLAMYFGMFGSVFLLAQFFQTVHHYSAFQAGVRTLPWTGMPMLVAPIAGLLSDRVGSRPLMVGGLALQAVALSWIASIMAVGTPYSEFIGPFALAGIGMALVFAPAANAVLGSVRNHEVGQASGATNAIREVGGVLGVAVLATVFTANGGYGSPELFIRGLVRALFVGAAVLAVGAGCALLIPRRRRTQEHQPLMVEAA
jgi:EmrB/QacA subfamily drug resistance transporter